MESGTELSLNFDKLRLIDKCFEGKQIKSFADLGGVWNVDGGYTFYTMGKHKTGRAVLVDANFTDEALQVSGKLFNTSVEIIRGNFGDQDIANRVGQVDAILLFDVLLHQAKPSWKDILSMYAPRTEFFLVYNPQWMGKESVRLLDLGLDEYFKNIPHTREHPSYRDIDGKTDATDIWQWGITDRDLTETMRELGFSQVLYKNHGRFGNLKNFESHSFIFKAENRA